MKFLLFFLFLFAFGLSVDAQQNNLDKKVEGKVAESKKIEVMPEFPGGDDSFSRFLMKNLRFPSYCVENEISGLVMASFVVCEDGSLCQLKINQSKHRDFDAEVTKILQKMPNWKPGTIDGKPTKVYFELPINFYLEDDESIKPDTLSLNFDEINTAKYIDWDLLKEFKLRIRNETVLKITTKTEYMEKLANASPFDKDDHIYIFDIIHKPINGSKYPIPINKEYNIKVRIVDLK